MNSRFSLEGRVAVVTGGGTGIGRGCALVLAEHGADVVLAGRRPGPLEKTGAEIEALGRARARRTDRRHRRHGLRTTGRAHRGGHGTP